MRTARSSSLSELGVGQPVGLVEDRVGDRQLADIVQQTTERELAQLALRQPETPTDGDCERGDPAGVPLGGRILVTQPDQHGADAAAEERLLVLDQLAGAEVSDQRARANGVPQVERGRNADHPDAGDLEQVRAPARVA
jgi:hypothetical protein